MTNSTPLEEDVWSPSLALRVERVCNRFEEACKAGQRPRIEQYLSNTPERECPVLLRELLAVEIEYRSRSGEGATPEEYRQRFPEYTELIQDVLAQAPRPGTRDTPPEARDTAELPVSPGDRATPAVPGYE